VSSYLDMLCLLMFSCFSSLCDVGLFCILNVKCTLFMILLEIEVYIDVVCCEITLGIFFVGEQCSF